MDETTIFKIKQTAAPTLRYKNFEVQLTREKCFNACHVNCDMVSEKITYNCFLSELLMINYKMHCILNMILQLMFD